MSRIFVHVDGDAFFASCEISVRPYLRTMPVAVGKEKSMLTAVNYVAKNKGISRGMRMFEAKKICPDLVCFDTDHYLYRIFSNRMYEIVCRYSSSVEHYSVDECFADFSHVGSIETAYIRAIQMKLAIETELGITVSVGIGPTKVLAKISSKRNKPSGCTCITLDSINQIHTIPIGAVWGIGPQTVQYLNQKRVMTIGDLSNQSEQWISEFCDKHTRQVWYELRGVSVLPIEASKDIQKSIQRTRTFTPPSRNMEYVWSELVRNVESACYEARKENIIPHACSFFIKTQEFQYKGADYTLSHPTYSPHYLLEIIRERFEYIFRITHEMGILFRTTGITLRDLRPEGTVTEVLFVEESVDKDRKFQDIMKHIDSLSNRFGMGIVTLTSAQRRQKKLYIKKRFRIPVLHCVV